MAYEFTEQALVDTGAKYRDVFLRERGVGEGARLQVSSGRRARQKGTPQDQNGIRGCVRDRGPWPLGCLPLLWSRRAPRAARSQQTRVKCTWFW